VHKIHGVSFHHAGMIIVYLTSCWGGGCYN